MSDIRERLVRFAGKVCISTDTEIEAAATIDKLRDGMRDIIQERDVLSGENWELRAENEKLRAALKPFAEMGDKYGMWEAVRVPTDVLCAAAAALKETENK